MQSISSRQ